MVFPYSIQQRIFKHTENFINDNQTYLIIGNCLVFNIKHLLPSKNDMIFHDFETNFIVSIMAMHYFCNA